MNIETNKFEEQFIQSYKQKDDFPFNNKIEFKNFLKRMKKEGKEIEYFVKEKVLPKVVKPKREKNVGFKFVLKNMKHIIPFLLSRQKIPFDYYVARQNPRIKKMLEIIKNTERFEKNNKLYIIYQNKCFCEELKSVSSDEDKKE